MRGVRGTPGGRGAGGGSTKTRVSPTNVHRLDQDRRTLKDRAGAPPARRHRGSDRRPSRVLGLRPSAAEMRSLRSRAVEVANRATAVLLVVFPSCTYCGATATPSGVRQSGGTLLLTVCRRDSARFAAPWCVFLAAAFTFAACGSGAGPASTSSGAPAAATNAGASPTAGLTSAPVESSAAVQPSQASSSAATGASPTLSSAAAANQSCTLFAPAEIGALLKQSITRIVPAGYLKDFSSCTFAVDAWQGITVSISNAAAGDNRTSGSFEWRAIQTGAKPLSGLGDKAFFIDIPGTNTLSIGALKGTRAIYLDVSASAPTGSPKPLDSLGSQTVLDAMKALVAVGLAKV